MYRLKENGLKNRITVFMTNPKENITNASIVFKDEKGKLNGYINGEIIGTVREKKDINTIRHLTQLHMHYYAWVEDVEKNIVVVQIARPTEIIIGLHTIAINTSNMEGMFNRAMYQTKDFPIPFENGPLYIAKDAKTANFYLFSTEQKKTNFALVLEWKNDQLYALKQEPLTYKAENKMRLLEAAKVFDAKLEFYDSVAAREEDIVEIDFNSYFDRAKGYLKAWNEYLEFEQRILNEKAQICRPIQYDSYSVSYGKVIFHLVGHNEISEWLDEVGNITVEIKTNSHPMRVGLLRYISYSKVEVDYLVEDSLDGIPFPKKGDLRVSKELEEVAQRRRKKALDKTLNLLSVIPNLGSYLSEPATVDEISQMKYSFPLYNVATLVNGKSPDIPQEQAIKAALNSEDLMLIQGPPGTGKTSVIQTIMKCLIELDQKDILLTSYQHLAVDNAIQGLTEHGVLSHRFGGETYQQHLLASYQEIVNKMVQPILTINEIERNDQQFIQQFINDLEVFSKREFSAATVKGLVQFIERVEEYGNIPTDVFIALIHLKNVLPEQDEIQSEQPEYLKQHYNSLPTMPKQIKTTGDVEAWQGFFEQIAPSLTVKQNEQAEILLKQLKKLRRNLVLLKNSEDIINQLTQVLNELGHIAVTVISNTTTKNDFSELNDAIHRLLVELEKLQEDLTESVVSEEQKLLQNYAMQLQADPLDVANLIGKYAQVKGATCQQTVAKRHGMYDNIFDAVIIDEAARANPLDLLIPMTLGKKVILVGDHKQLPHILEPQFEKETELSKINFDDIYSKSLFERLFNELPKSKKVMLKKQFRMHPHIGQLVSQLFYPEGLQHGLPEHALPNETGLFDGKHLAWVDVPFNGKGEQGRYSNEHEADVVIEQVKKLLQDAKNIGKISIITFYSEQLAELKKKLKVSGLEESVAVGTVDAFQGKESDIVILSTVRSNKHKEESRALGFLRSPNRFNVALSRARSLLIIVGDSHTLRKSDMFSNAYHYIEEWGTIEKYH